MSKVNRRDLIKTAGLTSGLMAISQVGNFSKPAQASNTKTDSLAMQLYKSLSQEQRQKVCLPVDHAKRQYISNWWYVHPEHRIPTTFNKEQKELIQQVFDSCHTQDFQAAINKQVKIDQYGQEKNAPSIGFFGTPQDKDFEFLYTGHHVTRRCSAHNEQRLGFGGAPLFYGHFPDAFNETKDHPGNPYWYQGKIFNEFVQTLDGKQQGKALTSTKPRSENSAKVIVKKETGFDGLSCAELSSDQQEKLLKTMGKMLTMFRQEDVNATIESIKQRKLVDQFHVSYYDGKYDVGSDQVWDTWQIESPELVWYYRGQPHIHSYFHLKS